LLAHMGESGDLASPDSLRDVILAREGRLASTTRTLLRTAAGIGPEFSVAVLEGVQPGRGAPRCARRGQRRGADRRTRARGLRVQAPLVRRTLHRDLPTARRARLHGQVPGWRAGPLLPKSQCPVAGNSSVRVALSLTRQRGPRAV